jgi:hypothetical protein
MNTGHRVAAETRDHVSGSLLLDPVLFPGKFRSSFMGSGAKMLKRFDGLRGLKKKNSAKKKSPQVASEGSFLLGALIKSSQKSNTRGGSTTEKSLFRGLSCYETFDTINCYS